MFNRFEKVSVIAMALLAASACFAGAKFLAPETQEFFMLGMNPQLQNNFQRRQELTSFLLKRQDFELECSTNFDNIVESDVVTCSEGAKLGSFTYQIYLGRSTIKPVYPNATAFENPLIVLKVQVPKARQEELFKALAQAMIADAKNSK